MFTWCVHWFLNAINAGLWFIIWYIFTYIISDYFTDSGLESKPIMYAFQKKGSQCTPRQFRYNKFISQFSTDIRQVSGEEYVVAVVLSRVEEIKPTLELRQLAATKKNVRIARNICKRYIVIIAISICEDSRSRRVSVMWCVHIKSLTIRTFQNYISTETV